MPHRINARIIENSRLNLNYYRLKVEAPSISREALPGQFAHLRKPGCYDPLLRRPLSIFKRDPLQGTVEFLYQVVGKGTAILAECQKGISLDIIGPLGQGFFWGPRARDLLLVGGCIGVAPLLFSATAAACQGKKVTTLIGAQKKEQLLAVEEFEKISRQVLLATDDGSLGYKGQVTQLLSDYLEDNRPDLIMACGPTPMLREVAREADACNIDCQVSLEESMGCGLGACRGCVRKTRQDGKSAYRTVCKDGPVFDAREVVWDEWG